MFEGDTPSWNQFCSVCFLVHPTNHNNCRILPAVDAGVMPVMPSLSWWAEPLNSEPKQSSQPRWFLTGGLLEWTEEMNPRLKSPVFTLGHYLRLETAGSSGKVDAGVLDTLCETIWGDVSRAVCQICCFVYWQDFVKKQLWKCWEIWIRLLELWLSILRKVFPLELTQKKILVSNVILQYGKVKLIKMLYNLVYRKILDLIHF